MSRPPAAARQIRTPHAVAHLGWILGAVASAVVLIALLGGVPYGLVRYVGWPLPDHIPSWNDIQTTLLLPLSPHLLLDLLACGLWPLWARFAISVLAALPASLRARDTVPVLTPLRTAPLRSTARLLVGALVFFLIHSRTASATTSATPTSPHHRDTVAVAPPVPGTTQAPGAVRHPRVVTEALHTNAASSQLSVVTVRAPEHGVHDSLWRIAARCLGDGDRWPEIWHRNQNSTQPGGQRFTTPNNIRPGWQLHLPPTPHPSAPPHHPPPHDPDGSTHEPAPTPPAPATSAPPRASTTPPPTLPSPRPLTSRHHDESFGPASIALPSGAYVGIGLAALITAAAATVRLRRRRDYRPGSRPPADPARAPVVRALRIAHDATTSDGECDEQDLGPTPARTDTELAVRHKAMPMAQEGTAIAAAGTVDGRPVAVHLARQRGLGLVGDGATNAARALIITLLAQLDDSHGAQHPLILLPQADFDRVFGTELTPPLPAALQVMADLSSALDTIETELLHRAGQNPTDEDAPTTSPLVLLATPNPESEQRLQALLDNGSTFKLAGILLGHWRPGGTLRISADGTVTATSPTLTSTLTGARLFTLTPTDTADLLTLLHAAHPTPPPDVNPATAHPPGSEHYEFAATPPELPDIQPEPPTNTPSSFAAPGQSADSVSSVHLHVLGRLQLLQGTDPETDFIDTLAPRQRAILVFLALHRDGTRRETLTAALWPEAPGNRSSNTFRATLSPLRRALATATNTTNELIVHNDGHYALNPAAITVDLWQLHDTLTAHRHATTPHEQTNALQRISTLYCGDLADGMSADWVDAPREALRREVLDAYSSTIRRIRSDNPEESLFLLERARLLDPYNEAIYRDIMRTQAHLHHHDGIPRTVALLATALGELDQQPHPDTRALAGLLCRPKAENRP